MTDSSSFMTDHEMIKEIRNSLNGFLDEFENFKDSVVYKAELNMWRETQRNTRRWALSVLFTVIGLTLSATIVVLTLGN